VQLHSLIIALSDLHDHAMTMQSGRLRESLPHCDAGGPHADIRKSGYARLACTRTLLATLYMSLLLLALLNAAQTPLTPRFSTDDYRRLSHCANLAIRHVSISYSLPIRRALKCVSLLTSTSNASCNRFSISAPSIASFTTPRPCQRLNNKSLPSSDNVARGVFDFIPAFCTGAQFSLLPFQLLIRFHARAVDSLSLLPLFKRLVSVVTPLHDH